MLNNKLALGDQMGEGGYECCTFFVAHYLNLIEDEEENKSLWAKIVKISKLILSIRNVSGAFRCIESKVVKLCFCTVKKQFSLWRIYIIIQQEINFTFSFFFFYE